MEQRLNIYPNREKTFEKELKRLEKSNISVRNRELITKFQNYLFSRGNTGSLRVAKVSSQLRRICAKLKKDLDKLDRDDITNLIALYNKDVSLSEATKGDYRRTVKQFYLRWFKNEDLRLESDNKEKRLTAQKFYRFLEEEVTTAYRRKQADPETIITEQECDIVVEKGCRTAREKAFVFVLHETGARAGEFLNMKLCDIKVKDNFAVLSLDGKTGKRQVFITKSLPHLIRYLDVHSFKDNQNSYLWLSEANQNRNEPLLHKGSQKLIDRCFERAGVRKKHNLHWFRHSRATILAPKMTTTMLCKYMGWTLGSRQIRTYCHLSVKQLEDTFLSMNGIKPKEEETEKPIKCICGAFNRPVERYCFKCCKPLKVETVIQDQELVKSETDKTVKFLMEMASNPELMSKFKKFKEQMRRNT